MLGLSSLPQDLEIEWKDEDGLKRSMHVSKDLIMFRPILNLGNLKPNHLHGIQRELGFKAFWFLIRYLYTDKLKCSSKMPKEWMEYEKLDLDTALELIGFCCGRKNSSHIMMLLTGMVYDLRSESNTMRIIEWLLGLPKDPQVDALLFKFSKMMHRAIRGGYLHRYQTGIHLPPIVKPFLLKAESTNYIYEREELVPSSYCQDMLSMLQHGKTLNFVLKWDDQVVKVHRELIMARCPYFSAFLSHEWKENYQDCLVMDQDSPHLMKFIQFLYTNDIDVNEANLLDMIVVADHFIMPSNCKIFKYCRQKLVNVITCTNCINLWTYFVEHDNERIRDMRDVVEEWLKENYDEVMKVRNFEELPKNVQVLLKERWKWRGRD